MAEFVVKIKLQLENLGIGPTASSGGRPATPVQAPSSQASEAPKTTEETRQAFSGLSADVRAFASAISQVGDELTKLRQFVTEITNIKSSTGPASATPANTGASREAISVSKAESDATKENTRTEQAATEATKQATEATKQATEALHAKADAEQSESEATKKVAAEAAATARNLGAVGNVLAELHKRAQAVQSVTGPERAPINPNLDARFGSQLTTPALFADVLNPIAVNKEFRAKAAAVNDSFKDLFSFEKGLDSAKEAAAEKARGAISEIIRRMVQSIDKDPSSASAASSRAKGSINAELQRLRTDDGVKGTFNTGVLQERASARGIVNANAQIESALKDLGKALASGAEESVLAPLEHAVIATIESLKQAVALELGRGGAAFVVQGSQGQNNLGIRAAQEIEAKGGGIQLNAFQQKVVDTVTSIIKTAQPLDAVRAAFKLLATDVDNFEDNMRVVRDTLSKTGQASLGGVENFKKKEEALAFLNIRRDSKGRITGSGAAVGEAEGIFNVAEINRARQSLSGRARGSSTVLNQTVTDESGNIKKVQVALTQLGATFDSVSIKGKALSDNMFDRTSVRTALNRVAVWGAAAGLIFGAVSAFKSAVDTVIKTESSIFTLAKVMDEAQTNFKGFVEEATNAGLAIAQKFGQPLEDVIATMTIFAQQGLSFPDVKSLTEASALAANVTTLNQPTAASALTAATQQFGLQASDATSIVDKFNNVANNAAVTETVLAEAIKKTGSAAVNAGISLDQFNGLVAAISEQTREGGSEIGTALKFIFSRLQSPDTEKGLARVGVAVRDTQGAIRPFVDIIADLASKFDTLSESQQAQAAIALAGGRRFNTVLALVKNFGEFQQSTANSINSVGSALREQEKITTTAGFKLTQLKNSAAGVAVSFGSVLLPVMKISTEAAKGFLDQIAKIPDVFKIALTSLGAAGIIFAKFSQQAIGVIDLLDKSGTGGSGIFSTIAGAATSSVSKGISKSNQRLLNPATFDVLEASRPGVNIARSLPDFSGFKKGAGSAKAFADELKVANLQLVDTSGNVIKQEVQLTKFAAAVRGIRVKEIGKDAEATALGLSALNSPLSKIAGSFVVFSNAILRTGVSFATLGTKSSLGAFDKIDGALGTLTGSLLRVAAAAGGIFLLIQGFKLIKDAVSETGDTIKAGLSEEIATRQEAIVAIQKQKGEVDSLNRASSRLASITIKSLTQSPALKEEDIRLGNFKSPLLEKQRFNEAQRAVSNDIGFNSPELISGIDEFGNVALKGADSFEKLADSVDSTQKSLLALTKIKAIEGFIKDLQPASGGKAFFGAIIRGIGDVIDIIPGISGTFEDTGRTVGDKFQLALRGMEDSVKDFRSVLSRELGGVDLKLIDPAFAATFEEQSQKFQENALEFRKVIDTIRSEIKSLPEDTGELLLRSQRVVDFTNLEGRRLASETGTATTGGQVRQQLFLQNRKSFKGGFGENIGLSGEETVAKFNEKGILQRVLSVSSNVQDALKTLKGGELVVTSLLGSDAQIEVVVNEFGERLAKSIDETTGKIKLRPLSEIIKQNNLGAISIFDPKAIKEQIERSLLELERVVSGAGRGSILPKDIEIGANRKFELSGQQRASITNEGLFADALKAQKQVELMVSTFKDAGEGLEDVGKVTSEAVVRFNELANQSDAINTIIRFQQEVENVGKSFEQAIDTIQSSRIGDAIKAQFSGILGAGQGLLPTKFQTPLLPSDVTGPARFGTAANPVIAAGNAISTSEVAQGERLAGLANLNRVFDVFTRDLESVRGPGGARDANSLSQLQQSASSLVKEGLAEPLALQIALQQQGVSVAEAQLSVLNLILDSSKGKEDPKLLGAQLADVAGKSNEGNKKLIAERIGALGPDIASQFTPVALKGIQTSLGSSTPSNITDALIKSNSRAALGPLGNELLQAVASKDKGDTNLVSEELLNKALSLQGGSSSIQDLLTKTVQPFARDLVAKQGGSFSVGDDKAKEVATAFGNELIKAASGASGDAADLLEEKGNRIVEGAKDGNREILDAAKKAVLSAAAIPLSKTSEVSPEAKRDVEETKKLQQDNNKAIIESGKIELKLAEALKNTISSLNLLVDSLASADKGISDSLATASSKIASSRTLGGIGSSIQSGTLRGTFDPNFSSAKPQNELTGSELVKLQNKDLINTGNELQVAFEGNRQALVEATTTQTRLSLIKKNAAATGDIEGFNQASDAIAVLGQAIKVLTQQGNNAADALDKTGKTLSNLQSAADLVVGVRDALKGFENQIAQLFDTTSIDSALGRGPFAIARPTFEQFQQGQGGRLTSSERANESIDFKQRSGQISPQEAGIQKQQVEFTKNEDIIAAAQAQENKKFELEIDTAKNIRAQALSFAQRGGSGASRAQALVDQLTNDLESAGDLVKSNVSDKTIRNPLTGQDQSVPASEILQFKGVSSLDTALQEVQALSAEVQTQDRAANAQPIVDALVTTSDTTHALLQSIVDVLKQTVELKNIPNNKDAENLLSSVKGEINDVIRSPRDAGNAARLNIIQTKVNQAQDSAGAGAVALAGQTLQVPGIDGVITSVASALTQLSEAVPATIKPQVEALVADLAQGSESFKAINTKSDELVISFTSLSTLLPAIVDGFAKLQTSLSDFSSQASGGKTFGPPAPTQALASGGLVNGRGGPTEDKVGIMASPGEFVVKASSVKKLGVSALTALNAGVKPQRFAEGGFVLDDEEVRKAEELRRKRLLAVGIDPDSKAQTISVSPLREAASKDEKALENADKLKGLADVTLNSTRDAETLRGLLLDDVGAKVELARKGSGLRFGHAIPGTAVRFEDGKPVFTNAGFDENRKFLRGPDDKIIRDAEGNLRRVASDSREGGTFPLDSSTLGLNFEDEKSFTREYEGRRKLEVERESRAAALQLKTKAVDLINKAQSNIFAEKTLADISGALPGPTANLNRQFNTALSNLTRVAALSQTAEGRQQLDAELNPSQKGGATLDREINQSAAALASLGEKFNSLQRGPINVFDQSTGGVRTVGEAYFGPGASIDPFTGNIKGEVFSSALENTIARFGATDLKALVAQAKGISGQRAGKFNYGLGGSFGALAETVADTKRLPGLLKLPANIVLAGGSFVEDSTRGVADIGYGALKVAGNVATGDFGAAGKALKSTGKAITGLPAAALKTGFNTAKDTGQAAGAYGAGIFLSLKGDGQTADEAFSDAATKGFSATKGALETYTAIEGGIQAFKRGKAFVAKSPIAGAVKNKLATFKANRAVAKSEAVAKANALKEVEAATKAAKAAEIAAPGAKVSKLDRLKGLATPAKLGTLATVGLQGASEIVRLAHPALAEVLQAAAVGVGGLTAGGLGLKLGLKGIGGIKKLFGKAAAPGVTAGASELDLTLGPAGSKASGALSKANFEKEIAKLSEQSGFQFPTRNLDEFVNESRFANNGALGTVDARFGGTAVTPTFGSQAVGAFNARARGGTSIARQEELAKAFSKALSGDPQISRTPGAVLRETAGPRGVLPRPNALPVPTTRKFNLSKLEAEKQRVLNTPGIERQVTTASGEINNNVSLAANNSALNKSPRVRNIDPRRFPSTARLLSGQRSLEGLDTVAKLAESRFLPENLRSKLEDLYGGPYAIKTKKQAAEYAKITGADPSHLTFGPGTTGKIHPGSRDFFDDLYDTNPSLPRLSKESAEIAKKIMLGHEFDELVVPFKQSFEGFGHNSPSVILREHNRLASLPSRFGDVREYFKVLRSGDEASVLSSVLGDKFVYGQSPRLSRSAIKSVTNSLEDKLGKKKFAFGGSITGPGGPEGDQVPILASAGEFILNADAVKRIGLPQLSLMNQTGGVPSGLPRFKDGGLVGDAAGGSVRVDINSDEVSKKISGAITDALKTTPISLDIPAKGLPIDTSSFANLNLGENLGSAVRNKLEAMEGSVAAIREDVSLLTEKVEAQYDKIMTDVFTMVNEQISNIQGSEDLSARMEKDIVAVNSDIGNLSSRVAEAIDIASRALSQALARV